MLLCTKKYECQNKQNMHKDSFDFVYNAEGDYYDLVVDTLLSR